MLLWDPFQKLVVGGDLVTSTLASSLCPAWGIVKLMHLSSSWSATPN